MPFIERKQFTDEQYEIAGLIALGCKTSEIIERIGCTNLTINRYKRDADFHQLISNLRDDLHRFTIEDSKNFLERDIRKFRTAYRATGQKLTIISNTFLDKIHQRIDSLDPDDISPGILPSYVRSVSDLIKIAEECNQRSLGLDKLLDLSDEFSEVVEANRNIKQPFNQRFSQVVERNKEQSIDAEYNDSTE